MKFWWIVLVVGVIVILICNALRGACGNQRYTRSHEAEEEVEDMLDWFDEEDRLNTQE